MGALSDLVNENKIGFSHLKSGEGRSGYLDIKDMVEDVIELFRLFKDIDKKEYPNELVGILEEFCLIVPMIMVEEIKLELENQLKGE